MKHIHHLYTFLILFCAMFMVQEVAAQVVGNKYSRKESETITHKAAKWFDLREDISPAAKAMDTFDDDIRMFTVQDGSIEVQAAHTYMDTLYVHKGTSVTLEIPDQRLGIEYSANSYQRWHSFRTDGIFRTKNTGSQGVWDLLTPVESGSFYRYANGYVGNPTGDRLYKVNFYVPTDAEFNAWFDRSITQKYDNNYYLVACDVSSYTDYTKNFDASSKYSWFGPRWDDGKTYEPTLTHRMIFYIVAVDDSNGNNGQSATVKNSMDRLVGPDKESYRGGTLAAGKKYLEEVDISFPYTRVSNYTDEVVALSKDAWSYAIPGVSKDWDTERLDVHLADYGSGITLATTSLQGMNRVIQFKYPNLNYGDGTRYVNANNSQATIYVTKTVEGITYNIARFNLTFVRDTRLLTQTQLQQIEDGTIQDEDLKYYQFRTDSYLEQNYQLLTSLNFDYDPEVADAYGSSSFYPFPLAWTANSYAFFDGAEGSDFANDHKYPEWGYYAIMKDLIEVDHWNNVWAGSPLPGSTYHMYIDASDRPGVIARLPFRQKLCKGSELFVTAWLKSAGWGPTTNDAGMLFSVMGVRTDPVMGTVYEPIYRHSSSQVRRTDYLSNMPGTGPGTNQWFQMYFSFIIDADADYDSYVLQVDNNSASTEGGDMYIDDIRVYIATPNAEVTQLEATCTSERTLMNIKLDWDRLLSRLGEKEGQDKIDAIDFCFIDKAKYDEYLSLNGETSFQEAIEYAVVEVGENTSGSGYNRKYNTLYFNLDFEQNADYDTTEYPRLASKNEADGRYYFYGTTDESGKKSLAVDFYSDLTPNRAYMLLIQINDGNEATSADFEESIDDICGINTSFYVTSQTLLRVNGEVIDPTVDFCAGQIFNFSAQLRVPKQEADGSESYIIVDQGVYFDWFFGTEDEFLAPHVDYGNESLQSALSVFREIFPDKEDLTDVEPGMYQVIGTTEEIELTADMIAVIKRYLDDVGDVAGIHNRLVLHKENLDITLLNSGLRLVVQPIQELLPPDGTIDTEAWAKVCWNYVPLELHVSGDAPQLHAGFNPVHYPSDDFNPSLRIGLGQIAETTFEKPLRIALRGAKLVSEDAKYIGMITATSAEVYSKIYLIDTDDPAYRSQYFPEEFSEFSLPIGLLKSLHAEEYNTESSFQDYMEVYFDMETVQANGFRFQPKEGYYYTFAVHFEEHGEDGENASNACFGKFTVKMKVVPEYLVWQGKDATSNWNKDENWKRADKSDLKKAANDNSYQSNEANTTSNGFVPMLFSNVVMPRDSKVELYMAGYKSGVDNEYDWEGERPSYMELPTDGIQYDLMAYDSNNMLSTQRYRVNLCHDIHFEPGAQMLHAEQLLYNKAWTDVEIAPGQWTAVSIPSQGVVAGDWYTPTSGRQETEYFKDITFGVDNNRLNPAVYQRSWSSGAKIVENGGVNTVVSFDTEWSSAYNDASVPYVAGGGFSIKGVASDDSGSLLFRFPKADTHYSVSTGSGNIDRTHAGKLLISGLLDRSNPLDYNPQDEVMTTLVSSADGKYLMIGNPFMAPLNVQTFVAYNSDVLAQKYWIDPDRSEGTAVAYDPESGWSAPTSFIAPYAVFYVETQTPAASGLEIKFTKDMQQFEPVIASSPAPSSLKITAENIEGSSSATVRYTCSASNDFGQEDAQMIRGLTGNVDNTPKVYTVAGNTALSVNQVKDMQRIPLGVAATEGSVVTLTFSGVTAVEGAALYDAELQSETPLYEGYQLTLNGSSYGRYFICGQNLGTTGVTETLAEGDVNVSSIVPQQVVVTSNTELRSVSIWSVSGILLRQVTPQDNYACTIDHVDSGIVIVRVDTATGVKMVKLKVR